MHSLVEELTLLLRDQNKMMTSAESCTGGLIAAAMTDRAGSSSVYERGFITYSNESKVELLGVKPATLETFGAVSDAVAREMAAGALSNSRADIAVSVTGIAGPGGGSPEKPVGLVFIGIAHRDGLLNVSPHIFDGGRLSIRQQTVETALRLLIDSLGGCS